MKVGGANDFIDLTTTLTDAPDSVEPGANLTYTLTVLNGGSADAFNVKVQDTLPAGTTFVSATGTDGFTCSEAGGVVTCTGGTVGAGGSQTITIVVKAPLAHGISIVDLATADPDNDIPESNEGNNSSSTTTTVTSQIDLTTSISGPSSSSQNSNETYTFTVSNTGTSNATNVAEHIDLPVGIIVLNVNPTGNFGCQVQQNPVNVVDCVGDLAGGASVTITIDVFISATGVTLEYTARVDPDNTIVESDETNNTDTHTTSV